MKNKSIIYAVAGLLLVTPAIAGEKSKIVSTYGQIEVYVEGGSSDTKNIELRTKNTRAGLKFNYELKECRLCPKELSIFGELSADIDGNGANALKTRYAYVGVKHYSLGALSAGRTKSIAEYSDKADVFEIAGNNGVQKVSSKLNNSLKYEHKVNGVRIGAQMTATDESTNENVDLWQVAAQYYGVAVTYSRDNLNNINYYGIGAERDFGPVLIAASYTVKDPEKVDATKGVEGVLGYDVTKQLTALVGYQDTDVTNDDGTITAGIHYKFAKNTTLFTEVDKNIFTKDYVFYSGFKFKF